MRIPLLAAAFLAFAATPASACLTCGCSGSGISGDVSSGGNAFLFSNCARVMVQQGISARAITGAFTDSGAWHGTPTGSSLTTLTGNLGVLWYPTLGTSLALNVPLVGNSLQRATWGPLGSIAPTEIGGTAAALGDLALQGAAQLVTFGDEGRVAAWVGMTLPTGTSVGDPVALTGAGVVNGQVGLLASTSFFDDWLDVSASAGYQRPLTNPPLSGTTFYIGNAFLGQLNASHTFNPGVTDTWSLGLGLAGYRGTGRFGPNDVAFTTGKIRVVPSFQYDFDLLHGVRVSLGVDPFFLGTNAMTDATITTTFYQGFM